MNPGTYFDVFTWIARGCVGTLACALLWFARRNYLSLERPLANIRRQVPLLAAGLVAMTILTMLVMAVFDVSAIARVRERERALQAQPAPASPAGPTRE